MIFSTEAEVLELLKPIIDAYKKVDSKLFKYGEKAPAELLPEFYPNYRKAVEYAERIKVHSEIGDFPEKLFKDRSPNQTQKEYDYMKANFKQNTLPVFVDYLSTNSSCFNDGNWNLTFRDQNDVYEKMNASFQQYVENQILGVESLENYMKFVVANNKSVDANGVIAVKPKEIFYADNTETEELIIDNSRLLEPQPYYYPCRRVLSDPKFDSEYFILESCDKSKVEYGATKAEPRGHVFEVYDEENIWRIEQVGKFTDYKFEVSLYFQHGWEKVPASRLKGIPQTINDSILWQSQFLFGCDLLDLALMNENYLQCTLANTMFPYRVMLGTRCKYQHRSSDGQIYPCTEGYVFDSSLEKNIECPVCHTAGVVNRVSPLGEILLFPEDMFNDGEKNMTGKAMYYVSPETTASEFVLKKIDRDIAKAYDVVKATPASQSDGKGVSGDGTATGTIMNIKARYAAIKMFSDQCFSIYEFLLNAIGWQRYASDHVAPILSYPVTFDFNTEQDYLDQITKAQNAKLAPFIIQSIIFKYLNTLYYNEKQTAMIFNLIVASDRFLVFSSQDMAIKERMGQALKWEVVLHDSAIQFVDELIDENRDAEMCSQNDCTKGFFAIDFAEQKEMLIAKAKAKADSITAPSTTTQMQAVKDAIAA